MTGLCQPKGHFEPRVSFPYLFSIPIIKSFNDY